MKVYDESGQSITLSNKNFIAAGGEGNVFVDGHSAYKIYLDQKKAINPAKITELSVLKPNKRIVGPRGGLYNKRKRIVGYEMLRVPKGAITICEFSSRGYQNSNGVKLTDVARLADQLTKDIIFIHQKNILIVDLNEMNLLLHRGEIYYIDVDSYQTQSFPATAIMEHVRDYKATKWTEGSDWFSWGILTFQMFTGTHPFKGRHPDFGKRDLIPRMEKGVSVFNRKSKLPRNCIPLNNLPKAYRDWAKAVFEDEKRIPPPTGLMASTPLVAYIPQRAKSTRSIEISVVFSADTKVRQFLSARGTEVVACDGTTFINNRPYPTQVHSTAILALDGRQNVPIAARVQDHKVEITKLQTGVEAKLDVDADKVYTSSGRLYVKTRQGAVLEVKSTGGNSVYTTKVIANVMPRSSHVIGEGILYETFGQWFLVTTPREGESYQAKIAELAKKKIVVACYRGNVLMATVSNKGKFSRWVFRFNDTLNNYDSWEEKDIQPAALSFACLPNGICAAINEENKLELFQTTPGGIRKVVDDDSAIPPGTTLKPMGAHIVFIDNRQIKRVKTK